ncbi:NAD(P)-binding protein [Virgibacillus ihumii]|uniref:NAD(P)-binding protein n=1 Tax=Virgibacillus ihumii TaxID=2686091 RepID=UPI00157C6247|nr:NAD(P)-binding protein [Virgibacillus ihumii]
MAAVPLMIDLTEKNIIVIGGGSVAERRIRTVINNGAKLTVISPKINQGIHALWTEGCLDWKKKKAEAGDLDDAFLVIVATNDVKVNETIIQATPSNALINNAADADEGNVAFPSFFNRGRLSISVSTNGASPMLSAKIKNDLQAVYDNSYTDYVDFLHESRKLLKQTCLTKNEQRLFLKEILSDKFQDTDNQNKLLKCLADLSGGGKHNERPE